MVKSGQEMKTQGRKKWKWGRKNEKGKMQGRQKDVYLKKNDNHELNKNPTVYDRNGYIMRILEIDWNIFL